MFGRHKTKTLICCIYKVSEFSLFYLNCVSKAHELLLNYLPRATKTDSWTFHPVISTQQPNISNDKTTRMLIMLHTVVCPIITVENETHGGLSQIYCFPSIVFKPSLNGTFGARAEGTSYSRPLSGRLSMTVR